MTTTADSETLLAPVKRSSVSENAAPNICNTPRAIRTAAQRRSLREWVGSCIRSREYKRANFLRWAAAARLAELRCLP